MLYVKRCIKKTGICVVRDTNTGKDARYDLDELSELKRNGISVKGVSENGDFAYPVDLFPDQAKYTYVYSGRRVCSPRFDTYLRGSIKLPCGNVIERAYCEIDSSVYDVCGSSSMCYGLFATLVDSSSKIRTYPVELLDINETEIYCKLKGKDDRDNVRRLTYYGYDKFPVNQNVWKRLDIGKCSSSRANVLNTDFIKALSRFYFHLRDSYFVTENIFNRERATILTQESLASGKGMVYFNDGLWVPLHELLVLFIHTVFDVKEVSTNEYKFLPRVVDSRFLLPRGKENGILSFLVDLFYPIDTDDLCIFGDKFSVKTASSKKSVGEAILRRADDLVPNAYVEISGGFAPDEDLVDIVSVLTKEGLQGCIGSRELRSVFLSDNRLIHTLRGSFVFDKSVCDDFCGVVESSSREMQKSVARNKMAGGDMKINAKGDVVVHSISKNGDLRFLDKGLHITSRSLRRDLDLANLRRIFLPESYLSVARDCFLGVKTLPFMIDNEITLLSKNKRLNVVTSLINALYSLEERFDVSRVTYNTLTGSKVHEVVKIRFGNASVKPVLFAALLCSDYSGRGLFEQLEVNKDFINSFSDEDLKSVYELLHKKVLNECMVYNKVRFSLSAMGTTMDMQLYRRYLVMPREVKNLFSSVDFIKSILLDKLKPLFSDSIISFFNSLILIKEESESNLLERIEYVCRHEGMLKENEAGVLCVNFSLSELPSLAVD